MTTTLRLGHRRSRPRVDRLIAGRLPVFVALVGLMAWAVHARTRDLGAPLWIDEGISFGVAHHPLWAIPGVLRQDGAPPLFYMLLHVWTAVLGSTVRSGHVLSLLFAVLAIPAAFWATGGVFGRRAGVFAAVLVALDPFAATYAIEVRMYSMLLLMGLLATGAFLRAFVVAPGHRGWALGVAGALAAVMYTHNWGLFYVAAAGLVWLCLVAASGRPLRRQLMISGAIGFGGALVLFLPWLPIVVVQAQHTGAPWSHAPHWKSISTAFERLLGGRVPETVLLLFALAGCGQLLRADRYPAVRRAALATAGVALLTFAVAYAWSNLSSPAWALRYLVIVLAPVAIVIAAALSRAGPVAVAVLAVIFVGSWYGKPTHAAMAHKSNVAEVAQRLGPVLPAGVQVFSTQPEEVPVLHYYLPPSTRFATPLGRVADAGVMDWRDAMARLDRPEAATTFAQVLRRLRSGQQLLLVQPRFSAPSAPWTRRIRQLARRVQHDRLADPTVRVIDSVLPQHGFGRATVSALLLERQPASGQ
ncbi:hypothetical protein FSW04_01485 [Baekduia soli]|uniref:Uncharacterized protein n=1 Tax=Baekduia soli TaxID=496014 RepID=A0A5B8U091_9ACTN|nr:glycosyltransferase family 39 protein [Baekduia soli]QEC46380.1 hypothetical protein FSW04_01485 [Baekduia soli]